MSLKKHIGNLFIMTRSERNGVLVLVVMLMIVMLIRFFSPMFMKSDDRYLKEIEEKIAQLENQKDSIRLQNTESNLLEQKNASTSSARTQPNGTSVKSIKLFPFDPNTVNFNELKQLGFSEKTAGILIKYRDKGGRFNRVTDLLKVYGVDSSFFQSIEPYIDIKKDTNQVKKPIISEVELFKPQKPLIIEINSADSAQWTQLPGIGPVYAKRICNFRSYLGGFVNTEQIKEVYNFPEETYNNISKYLTVDATKIVTINLNFANVDELKKHPYCDFSQAKKIIEYRSKRGSYETVDQLLNDSVLSAVEFNQLMPYLRVK